MQKLNQRFTEIDALLIESLEKWETIEARAKG
jgi:ATP-binding cassette subfamily F protein uup